MPPAPLPGSGPDRPRSRPRSGTELTALVAPHRDDLAAYCYAVAGSTAQAALVERRVLDRAAHTVGPDSTGCVGLWLRVLARLEGGIDTTPASPSQLVARPADPWPDRWRVGRTAAGDDPTLDLEHVEALQVLPPRARAALLLRDAGLDDAEVAEATGVPARSVPAEVEGARRVLSSRAARASEVPGPGRCRAVLDSWTSAVARGDADAVLALLSPDVCWIVAPAAVIHRGRVGARAYLRDGRFRDRWRQVPTVVAGRPAVAGYAYDPGDGCHRARVLDVLTLDRSLVTTVRSYADPRLFPLLGLPRRAPVPGDEVGGAVGEEDRRR